MNNWIVKNLMLVMALALPLKSAAEDIDLFMGPSADPVPPNVLFILDNTGNWTQPFTPEIAALQAVFDALDGIDINVDVSTLSASGGVRVVGLQDVDVMVRLGQALAYNTAVTA